MSMDSATSESLQSSSGGDYHDFDSHPPPPDPMISSFLNLPPAQPPPQAHNSNAIFDPFPSYHISSFPRPFFSDLDAAADSWPPTHRYPPPPPPTTAPTCTPATASSSNIPSSSSSSAPRASKKRARASRRAPTTVLTTDTSNFRAMVQEFTGIPAPPFATSSFSRPRLDLLHSSAPSYLLQPFAQKLQHPAIIGNSTNTCAVASTLPSSSSSSIQNPNILNNQNPVLSIQSLLQQQHQTSSMCQWPTGYAGGELGSVIAGASADSVFPNSKRISNCKSDHAAPSHAEKHPAAEGTYPTATATGEGGDDPWQLSSD